MTFLVNQDIKHFVENNPNLVSRKETSYPGVYVLKYKKKVFYDNLWNEYLEECRGTLVDDDYNIVSRPFTKIYNYGIEKRAPILDDSVIVSAFRKVNGFMVAITWYNDDILVSTTGSTDSDYVKMALELIDREVCREVCKNWKGFTFMFECVHPNDPHIIPEEVGMHLLGYRENYWNSKIMVEPGELYLLSKQFQCHEVKFHQLTIGTLLKIVKCVKHEGFVFYTSDGISAKIKSPYYLTSKWLARNLKIDKIMRDDFKQQIDEEYYPLLSAIRDNINEYTAKTEQERLQWVRNFLENA
jgi:hypothetical protein